MYWLVWELFTAESINTSASVCLDESPNSPDDGLEHEDNNSALKHKQSCDGNQYVPCKRTGRSRAKANPAQLRVSRAVNLTRFPDRCPGIRPLRTNQRCGGKPCASLRACFSPCWKVETQHQRYVVAVHIESWSSFGIEKLFLDSGIKPVLIQEFQL